MKFASISAVGSLCLFVVFQTQKSQEEIAEPVEIPTGMQIVLSKSSLPISALQDLHLTFDDPVEDLRWKFSKSYEVLSSGKTFSTALLESKNARLAVDSSLDRKSEVPINNTPARTTRLATELPGLIIQVKKPQLTPPSSVQNLEKSGLGRDSENAQSNTREEIALSRRMQMRLDKVGGMDSLWEDSSPEENIEDPTTSLQSMAQFLVEKELARQQRGVAVAATGGSTESNASTKSAVTVLPGDGEEDHRKSSKAFAVSEDDEQVSTSASGEAVDRYYQSLIANVTIEGHLEMGGGLAYTGGKEKILIYRESEGLLVEEGVYWLRDGKYRIALADTSGILVAQFKDADGRLAGEGTFDLASLTPQQVVKGQIKGIDLVISPLVQGVSGQVVSAYSFDEYVVPVSEAQVLTSVFEEPLSTDGEGQFHYPFMVRRSSYQAKARASQYWGTLVAGVAGKHQQIKLFPESMVNALIELAVGFKNEEFESQAVIWGRIEQGGRPLEGAKVELAGSTLRPVYFNALMIPDKGLRSTGRNGIFAYVGVEPGVHQIRAWHERKWLPAQVVPAEAHHVSHVVIEKVSTHRVPVRVFDAFETGQPLSAILRVLGENNLVEIDSSGYGIMDLPLDQHLMFVEASSFGGYEAIRMVKSRSEKHLHLPMIQTSWIEDLAAQKKLSIDRQKGIVVGFVSGDSALTDYQGTLGTDRQGDYEITYFDSFGEFIDEPTVGGGFVMFNVEPGLQTVVVAPNIPLSLSSRLVYAEPGVVSVIQQTFR